ncbi:hypothetical protein CAC42_2262 [Sphaceloma murrayae]|uniref:Uncharacterized protein n=1 Tax=Sphaceloma murrayae TaxID=2082308 RepID=A0A2K1QJJ6_9PEZI|nr:hypothetical protein CAC42_2262 [Sphaceloma murrayae]
MFLKALKGATVQICTGADEPCEEYNFTELNKFGRCSIIGRPGENYFIMVKLTEDFDMELDCLQTTVTVGGIDVDTDDIEDSPYVWRGTHRYTKASTNVLKRPLFFRPAILGDEPTEMITDDEARSIGQIEVLLRKARWKKVYVPKKKSRDHPEVDQAVESEEAISTAADSKDAAVFDEKQFKKGKAMQFCTGFGEAELAYELPAEDDMAGKTGYVAGNTRRPFRYVFHYGYAEASDPGKGATEANDTATSPVNGASDSDEALQCTNRIDSPDNDKDDDDDVVFVFEYKSSKRKREVIDLDGGESESNLTKTHRHSAAMSQDQVIKTDHDSSDTDQDQVSNASASLDLQAHTFCIKQE